MRISNSKHTMGDIQLTKLNLKSLKVLDLSQNYFGSEHFTGIFENIKSFPLLEELNLEYCNIKCLSQFSFVTPERFPSLKRLFIIQQEFSNLDFSKSAFSPSEFNFTSLSIGICTNGYRNDLLSSIYRMKDLECITIKTSLPQTNIPVWSLRSNKLKHLSINENVFDCLIDWNSVSFEGLTFLSVECNTLSSELLSFLNHVLSFSSLSEFSIKINQCSTSGTENYVQLGLSLGRLTTLRKLHVNLMNFKDFYVTILSGECVERIEHLKFAVDEDFLDLSIEGFFRILTRFSNLKSLSVDIVKSDIEENITSNEYADLNPSKDVSFRKLEMFCVNFKCSKFLSNRYLSTMLKLMPKFATFKLVTMYSVVCSDIFDFNEALPIRFLSITSDYEVGDYCDLLWKRQQYLPFLTSLSIQLGTTHRVSFCKNFMYSMSLLKAIGNIEESAKFPTLTFANDAFLIKAMINCNGNESMPVRKSDTMLN